MAKLASIALILTIVCLLASKLDVYASKQGRVAKEEINFLRNTCPGKEKLLLKFFVQFPDPDDPNPTSYDVARASITDTSPTSFGIVRVQDRLVTVGPDPSSEQLGRYQGIAAFSDFTVPAITINNNMYFTSGEYANSTLNFLGRNQFYNTTREVVVSGGTGAFRFARGYSIQTNYTRNTVKFFVYIIFIDKYIRSEDVWISKK